MVEVALVPVVVLREVVELLAVVVVDEEVPGAAQGVVPRLSS